MQSVLQKKIIEALQSLDITTSDFVVDHPTDKNTTADYFSNVAMVAAKDSKESPKTIAEKLQSILNGSIPEVQSIEIAGPGFINFYLTRDFYTKHLEKALASGREWGRNDSWRGKQVLVEYTDPNPFKEFHIGHLFTNAVGESIARLFMMNGATTKRINYQGDVGLHVAKAVWGIQKLQGITKAQEAMVLSPSILGKAYALGATGYEEEEEAQAEIRAINTAIYEKSDEDINELYELGRKISLDYFETIYQTINTEFDEYFFESEAGPKGKELVLQNPDVFRESDGARIFPGEEHGLHTRVFLNKEGLPTYEAKELALAKMKEDKLGAYDLSIISTANEITEYFKVLKKAMHFVYPELAEKTEHIGHGTVRLSTGKMSSRTGDVIAATDFIAEVANAAAEKLAEPNQDLATDIAIAAIKYTTLKSNILQDTVFDKDQALSFEGDSGPYLQYTHARICSLLTKATKADIGARLNNPPSDVYAVEKVVYQFPEVVAEALLARSPHKITQYLTNLASEFNSFYATEKIIDSEDQYAPYKAAIAATVRQTLKNGLWILAIKAPEQM